MSRFSSLIMLINSLSKSERKSISSEFGVVENEADYVFLYKLIEKNRLTSGDAIKEEFIKSRKEVGLNTAINYLFDTLLTILSRLRRNQDHFFSLFNQLMEAKVLYEKSIYKECFLMLARVQQEALKFENFSILLIARKMELDYLLSLDFPDITENELLSKQYRINDTLKKIRKINEHASLYELLKHRILYKGTVRSTKQKQEFNDLVVSEMSIVSSFGFENFETQKTHKLFQSNYLINVGDYKSALHSFYELNNTFEQNKHLLSNPPMYYLMTIEGVLESLRTIRNYEGMTYFINQLNNIVTVSTHFRMQIQCVVFLYTMFPFLDRGNFEAAKELIDRHKEDLYDHTDLLTAARQVQLTLYTALVYLGTRDFKRARKCLTQVMISEKSIYSLPLYKTIRLVNMMVLYELNEYDYIASEARSVRRDIQSNERTYQIEHLILKLFNKSLDTLSKKERLNLWVKIEPELLELHNNKFELQLLRVFDFTAWVEAKIKNIPLSVVLKQKSGEHLPSDPVLEHQQY